MTKKQKAGWAFATGAMMIALLWPVRVLQYEQKDEIKIEHEVPGPDPMDHWLDELARFECEGCPPDYKRIDSNDRYSYSCLQFQEATFREMLRLYDPEVREDQVGVLILDCAYQKKIARALFEAQGAKASRHWYTSIHIRGLGLPPGL